MSNQLSSVVANIVEFRGSGDAFPEPIELMYRNTFNRSPLMIGTIGIDGAVTTGILHRINEAISVRPVTPLPNTIHISKLSNTIQNCSVGAYTPPSYDGNYDNLTYITIVIKGASGVVKITTVTDMTHVIKDTVDRSWGDEHPRCSVEFATCNPECYKALLDMTLESRKPPTPRDCKINVIVQEDHGGLAMMPCPVIRPVYNEDTMVYREHQELIERIDQQIDDRRRGLILLHGQPGTGKTSFVRHLIHHRSDRKFVFMPPEMFEQISSPSFIRFMMRTCVDSIIVVEDAERLLLKRAEADSSVGISTLLNLGDGLLSDVISAPIICTFNMDVKSIDEAVLRSGRLISRHEFKPLSKMDVVRILTSKGISYDTSKIGRSVTIADLHAAITLLGMGDDDSTQAAARLIGGNERSFGFTGQHE